MQAACALIADALQPEMPVAWSSLPAMRSIFGNGSHVSSGIVARRTASASSAFARLLFVRCDLGAARRLPPGLLRTLTNTKTGERRGQINGNGSAS